MDTKSFLMLFLLQCVQFSAQQNQFEYVSLDDNTDLANWKGKPDVIWSPPNDKWQTSSIQGTGYLESGFWPTEPARRLELKIQMEYVLSCLDKNDTSCLLNLEYYKADKQSDISNYTDTNITFPKEPFLSTGAITTTEYIDGMGKNNGVFLRFKRDTFRGRIESVNMGYYLCPRVSENLVDFPSEPAPDANEIERRISGNCAENSDLKGDDVPYMLCRYNGTYEVIGNCVCKPGYTPLNKECKECPIGLFKPNKGNDLCLKCGNNSKEGIVPRENCECKEGYKKPIGNASNPEADCFESPKWPSGTFVPTFIDIQSYVAKLSWDTPTPGSAALGEYRLKCQNCPDKLGFTLYTNYTNITLTDLSAYAEYIIEITNVNRITVLTGWEDIRLFNFTTKEGAPGEIQNPKYSPLGDGSVQFTWDKPFGSGSKEYEFVVTYGDKTLRFKESSFVIETDLQERDYIVKIHIEAIVNNKKIKGNDYTAKVTVIGRITLEIALAITFGVLIFVVVALIAGFCLWKRRNPAYLQVVRMPDGTVKLPARFYSGGKVYVDPKSYPDVDDAVIQFAYEIERDEIEIGEKIGEGEFCFVYKGRLLTAGRNYGVAVKMLKDGSSKQDRDDFLSEAAILGQFSDPNVIMLQGVVLKDEPNAIVLEYMNCGSLNKFLKEHDNEFTTVELLEMGRGISSGMKYLSEMGFIHRDLAARNILVNDNKQCKITDFGMSIEIKFDETGETTSGKVPVRWTAPEAIQFNQFTTASDVWSYGIVLWEIMSYGERPYWDWTNYQVLEKVAATFRLPPPMSCPGVVHDLMLQCWTKDRTKRPLFSIIRDRLDMWIRHPDLLEGSTIIELDDNLDYTIMQTINKWLEAIQMGRYAKNFLEQGFATPRQILLLTTSDLERLGIGALEHRKRIMKAIENTRKQVEAQVVRTSSVVGNSYAV